MKTKGFVINYEILEQTSGLTDEQFGALMRALITFDKTGQEPQFNDQVLTISFNLIKVMVAKTGQEKSHKQKENASPSCSAETQQFGKAEKADYVLELFNKIWATYPRKVGKEQAKATWAKKFAKLDTKGGILFKAKKIGALLAVHQKQWAEEINNKGERGRPKQFIPHFSTWLNDEIPNTEGK